MYVYINLVIKLFKHKIILMCKMSDEIESWDELNVPIDLLRGVYAYGFEKPSNIQAKACVPIIEGKDVIAQAQSGTGKTGAFSVGAIGRVNLETNTTQVLILSPTRELAKQSTDVINGIGIMMKGLRIYTMVGGGQPENDITELKFNCPHVIVGTPGRVFDMFRKNFINGSDIKLIVLDEADEMFSAGFKEQIFDIFQFLNKDVQVALFSATLPSHITAITNKIMRDPVKIIVQSEQLALDGISQFYVAIQDDKQKFSTLQDLFTRLTISQCIIYCNSVNRVVDLYEAMKGEGFPVCCIHSNMDKEERNESFTQFKNGKYRVLISSNITARGIDIQQVSIVINFDLPKDPHTYLHRIGRSGRWGRKGVGINFITRRDITGIKEIERYYNKEIVELPANFESVLMV
jgi:translation initiation factor 4A